MASKVYRCRVHDQNVPLSNKLSLFVGLDFACLVLEFFLTALLFSDSAEAKSGPFFLLRWQSAKQVLAAAGVGMDCWGFWLRNGDSPAIYSFDPSRCFENILPLVELLAPFSHVVEGMEPMVFSLEVTAQLESARQVQLQIQAAHEVVNLPGRSKSDGAHPESDVEDALDSDTDSMPSVASQETDIDEEEHASSEHEVMPPSPNKEDVEDTEFLPGRHKSGFHTVWTNSYFTLSNYVGKSDAKLIMKPRWATACEMGTDEKSKTLQIETYDGSSDANPPLQTYMVLRSWMLYRVQKHDWVQKTAARRTWYAKELADLEADCRKCVLSAATRTAVRKWCPDIL